MKAWTREGNCYGYYGALEKIQLGELIKKFVKLAIKNL